MKVDQNITKKHGEDHAMTYRWWLCLQVSRQKGHRHTYMYVYIYIHVYK